MVHSPEPPPLLPWAASFSSTLLDGRTEWRPGSLSLDRPSQTVMLLTSDGEIEEGRRLREGEQIQNGSEMVIMDCLVRVGAHFFPDRLRLTVAPGSLSPASRSPGSGLRFNALADSMSVFDEETPIDVHRESMDDGDRDGRVAAQVAAAVLDEDEQGAEPWITVNPRRKKSDEEVLQEC